MILLVNIVKFIVLGVSCIYIFYTVPSLFFGKVETVFERIFFITFSFSGALIYFNVFSLAIDFLLEEWRPEYRFVDKSHDKKILFLAFFIFILSSFISYLLGYFLS